jgi:hypothetical protein
MFNWFYWAINIGALSLIATTNIEKYHSFWLAFLLSTVAFLGSIVVLIIGRNKYVQKPPTGSLIIRAVQVTMTAIRIRRKLGKQSDRPDFLDYAKDMSSSNDHNDKEAMVVLNNNAFIDDLKKPCVRVVFFFSIRSIGPVTTNLEAI